MANPINGFIVLDKPTGLSSNRILQKVKRLLDAEKAGHAGTLDPLANGMLPICLGRATRLCSYFLEADKCYRTTIQLGQLRATGDAEGEVISELPVPSLNADLIESALALFRGRINQIPPMFSALKHQGKPLYELARQGIDIERKARTVTIYELELLGFNESTIELRVVCSKGTYIRTLGEEIAQALGTLGYLSALRREYCAGFTPEQLVTWEALEQSENPLDYLISVEQALDWTRVSITQEQLDILLQGKTVEFDPELSGRALLMRDDKAVAFAELDAGQVLSRKFLI